MRFQPTDEQLGFAEALDRLLGDSDVPRVARAWADGDLGPGRDLWKRLSDLGVTGLLVDENIPGGVGAEPIDMTIAFEALGNHCVPGPWVESAAYAARLVVAMAAVNPANDWDVGAADTIHTVAVPPHVPYALDADFAQFTFLVDGTEVWLAKPTEGLASIDGSRRLSKAERISPGPNPAATPQHALARLERVELDRAFDTAVLAVSAQLLGAGERLLADTVSYVKQRRQFGREIGSYQAVKHQLADVRIALDFARPLVQGAALTLDSPDGSRDVSAAKVAAGDAAYLASRVALQLHGAVGYTRELDLSLWITKVRALMGAWGTAAYHRGRVLDSLVEGR